MLEFVDSDSFDENIAKFLEYAKELDADKAQILIDLASGISTDESADRTRMRIAFNAEVVKKLDAHPEDEGSAA